MIALFKCGHPRTAANTYTRPGDGHQSCKFCRRVRAICRSVERRQRRINEGRLTRGERISAGLA